MDDWISKEQALGFLNDLFGEMQTVTFNNVLQSFEKFPSAFEGMTNGNVIQALLGLKDEQIDVGTYSVYLYPIGLVGCKPFATISRDWWNAPYKGVSE